MIGKKITLDGWKDYAGGLDVSGGMCSAIDVFRDQY